MRAVYKLPGEPAEIIQVENELRALQEKVGGYIECVHERIRTKEGHVDCVVIMNEDGRWQDMAPNIESGFGPAYVGPVLAVGDAGEDFRSLTPDEARAIKANFDARAIPAAEEAGAV